MPDTNNHVTSRSNIRCKSCLCATHAASLTCTLEGTDKAHQVLLTSHMSSVTVPRKLNTHCASKQRHPNSPKTHWMGRVVLEWFWGGSGVVLNWFWARGRGPKHAKPGFKPRRKPRLNQTKTSWKPNRSAPRTPSSSVLCPNNNTASRQRCATTVLELAGAADERPVSPPPAKHQRRPVGAVPLATKGNRSQMGTTNTTRRS